MRITQLAVSLGLALAVSARATVVEKSAELPQGWHRTGPAKGDEHIRISIALRQSRIDELRDSMLERARTGNHLSRAEVAAYQAPAASAVDEVQTWLRANGVDDSQAAGPWVTFNTTAAGAHDLFEADVGFYAYLGEQPVLRTQRYTVPSRLRGHIDFVYPLVHFMTPKDAHPGPRLSHLAARAAPAAVEDVAVDPPASCADADVKPICLRELYNWNYTAATTAPSQVRFAIAGFLDEFINYADVAAFADKYAPYLAGLNPPYNFTVDLINNGSNPQEPRWRAGMEASLDVQWALALAHPTRLTYLSTGGRGVKLDTAGRELPAGDSDNEPYLELLQHLLALPDDALPHVLSLSYADDEQSVPAAYARRVCDLFLQLAARGTTVLAATGDGGAAGIGRNQCLTNDGAARRRLLPTFPASCPWVTAVGATGNHPLAAGAAYSTGGFSEIFAAPAWQAAATAGYRARHAAGSKKGLFNETGRALPDISAIGTDFAIVWGGGPSLVTGTSASTPVVAAMVALADDARLRAGKGPLGWLTPALYADDVLGAGVFDDIVEGVSRECRFSRNVTDREPGWPAEPGWDAVTGLGVPRDLLKFIDALVKRP